jgi:hypothetical protein
VDEINLLEKYLVSPDSEKSKQLFSEQNISLAKDGPMSKSDASKKYFKFAAHTHPLYVATKNHKDYYLFY